MQKNNYMGRDGFNWFFAKVEDRHDPLCLGRVRIRVFGVHPEDENLVPNDHLPWAMPIQPITSAGMFGIGTSPTGPIEGTHVFGFFADGDDCQIPFVLGTVALGTGHFKLTGQSDNSYDSIVDSTAPVASLGKISGSFAVKAGPIGRQFMKDFGLKDFQAAAIMGNLGLESAGMQCNIRELGNGGGRGPAWPRGTLRKGYGWAQWTNPDRLDKFIDYVKANFNGYDITQNAATDDHNYAFLVHELRTYKSKCIPALKQTKTLEEATSSFMDTFEKPKKIYAHLDRRINYAKQALASMNASSVPTNSTAKNITNG
jgi:hypothetical protein